MFSPSKEDLLKNRRLLAMVAAANGFFVFPLFVILCSAVLKTSDVLCEHMLTYMGVSMMAPVLGYLYAAHNHDKDKKDGKSS
jgi:positive regulator of sigma E activity